MKGSEQANASFGAEMQMHLADTAVYWAGCLADINQKVAA